MPFVAIKSIAQADIVFLTGHAAIFRLLRSIVTVKGYKSFEVGTECGRKMLVDVVAISCLAVP